jgi:hypothetical protein
MLSCGITGRPGFCAIKAEQPDARIIGTSTDTYVLMQQFYDLHGFVGRLILAHS